MLFFFLLSSSLLCPVTSESSFLAPFFSCHPHSFHLQFIKYRDLKSFDLNEPTVWAKLKEEKMKMLQHLPWRRETTVMDEFWVFLRSFWMLGDFRGIVVEFAVWYEWLKRGIIKFWSVKKFIVSRGSIYLKIAICWLISLIIQTKNQFKGLKSLHKLRTPKISSNLLESTQFNPNPNLITLM